MQMRIKHIRNKIGGQQNRMKTCVETHGIGNQKIPMAIIDDTVYMSAVFWKNYLTF